MFNKINKRLSLREPLFFLQTSRVTPYSNHRSEQTSCAFVRMRRDGRRKNINVSLLWISA